jgi:hypothetical protein
VTGDIQWTVGEEVIVSWRGGLPRTAKVTRVTKSFVETSDGCKWNHNGSQRPRGDHWTSRELLKATPAEIASTNNENRRANLAYALAKTDFGKLPLETLRAIKGLVNP